MHQNANHIAVSYPFNACDESHFLQINSSFATCKCSLKYYQRKKNGKGKNHYSGYCLCQMSFQSSWGNLSCPTFRRITKALKWPQKTHLAVACMHIQRHTYADWAVFKQIIIAHTLASRLHSISVLLFPFLNSQSFPFLYKTI